MDSFEYKSHTIEVSEAPVSPVMKIDGVDYDLQYDPEQGQFNSAELPYQTFDSARALAQAVVDSQQD